MIKRDVKQCQKDIFSGLSVSANIVDQNFPYATGKSIIQWLSFDHVFELETFMNDDNQNTMKSCQQCKVKSYPSKTLPKVSLDFADITSNYVFHFFFFSDFDC